MPPPLSVTVFFSTHGLASQSVLLKTLGFFWGNTAQCSSSAGVSLSLKSGLLLREAGSVIDRQGLSLCVSSHESDTTQGLLKPRHRSGAALQEIRMRLIVYQTQFKVLVSRGSVFPCFLLLFSFQIFIHLRCLCNIFNLHFYVYNMKQRCCQKHHRLIDNLWSQGFVFGLKCDFHDKLQWHCSKKTPSQKSLVLSWK